MNARDHRSVSSPFTCLMLAACLAAQDDAPTIAVVHTWAELAAQPAIALPGGGIAHLGIQATEAAAGDGVMVWCLTEHWQPQRDEGSGEPFGPLQFDVIAEGQRELPAKGKWLHGIPTDEAAKSLCFATLVPAIAQVRMIITCRLGDRVVATAAVSATDKPLQPWTTLRHDGESVHDATGVDADQVATRAQTVHVEGCSALPRFDGMHPWHVPDDMTAALPSIPTTPDPGFILHASAKELVIDSDVEMSGEAPDRHLLVRWWVDGKPFAPADQLLEQLKQVDESRPVKRMRLSLRLDPTILAAHSGSRIGVQILLCPDGWTATNEPSMRLRDMLGDTDPLPRLSNRVDFVLP